jgi:tetratricopeptide (TPR) repeat protein
MMNYGPQPGGKVGCPSRYWLICPVLSLVALLPLAGCGGAQPEQPAVQYDVALQQFLSAGRDSFMLGRYTVAETQYRKAASLALLRDSAPEIAESGYDLAVAQLAAEEPAQAHATAEKTRRAVALRGGRVTSYLDLVDAAACYRLGQYGQARDLALAAVQGAGTMSSAHGAAGHDASALLLSTRAALVYALAADQQNDTAALARVPGMVQTTDSHAARALSPAQALALRADQSEIQALVARRTNPAEAWKQAEEAANLRRDSGNYHDMARALALAARSAEAAGRKDEAQALWTRAAQSAAAQGGAAGHLSSALAAGVAGAADSMRTITPDDANAWARAAGGVTLHPFVEDAPAP